MSGLDERMPYAAAFPGALGTGVIAQSAAPAGDGALRRARGFIGEYECVLSRFRRDSQVAAMAAAPDGGVFRFPDWAAGLFGLCDLLTDATKGAFDPCIGEDLARLGYDARYSFVMETDAEGRLGSFGGRPTWRGNVERHGTTLVTRGPVALDFGACGKGYLVDLLARILFGNETGAPSFVIDAGGDLLIHSPGAPVTVGLEDPEDPSRAVGVAHVEEGAFCASAPSRRHWGEMAGHRLHHLINAIDGRPVDNIAATWTFVETTTHGIRASSDGPCPTPPTHPAMPNPRRQGVDSDGLPSTIHQPTPIGDMAIRYPTALADGLATALFVASPDRLRAHAPYEAAILRADRTAAITHDFPGGLFQ